MRGGATVTVCMLEYGCVHICNCNRVSLSWFSYVVCVHSVWICTFIYVLTAGFVGCSVLLMLVVDGSLLFCLFLFFYSRFIQLLIPLTIATSELGGSGSGRCLTLNRPRMKTFQKLIWYVLLCCWFLCRCVCSFGTGWMCDMRFVVCCVACRCVL